MFSNNIFIKNLNRRVNILIKLNYKNNHQQQQQQKVFLRLTIGVNYLFISKLASLRYPI